MARALLGRWCKWLVCGLGDGCGERSLKTQNPCCADIAICFYRQDWADFRFLAGGTGVVRALVQMVGLRLGGRLRGNIAKNTKPLLCGDYNMFLSPRVASVGLFYRWCWALTWCEYKSTANNKSQPLFYFLMQ